MSALAAASTTVPFSAGTGRPATVLPAGACDCHMHVYDGRFPAAPGAALLPPDASVADYRQLQQRIGTRRTVLVTPSTYGTDNACMLAGLAALGDDARGVAVVDESVSDAELLRLHGLGVRGIRFNLSLGGHPPASSLRPLAERIAALGWHVQLLAPPETLLAVQDDLRSLPVPLIFDHLGRIAPAQAGQHPAHALVLELLRADKAWLKLSGGYIVSALHRTDDPAVAALAATYLDAAPHRLVWGSDWPHATASAGRHPMPDDAAQVDALARWTGTPERLHQVLVDNPRALYGFPAPAPISP
ncbi:amidohydrolase family protein [Xylophilus rhododendri]|uniref:Amidohydrolase family protein n=1 Tax=Xylophilus rhododendri TaxID=2697032 RepID=A0A857J371_9BURK|nr:amidohydrolase family protein [Xylophilus rhododendri]QHI98107.1 amidohydrolase family protein [Xylophilus rhododendri]